MRREFIRVPRRLRCLKHWLDERPDPRIIEAWKEYVKEMARLMPKESLAAMKTLMLDRCDASQPRLVAFWAWKRFPSTSEPRLTNLQKRGTADHFRRVNVLHGTVAALGDAAADSDG